MNASAWRSARSLAVVLTAAAAVSLAARWWAGREHDRLGPALAAQARAGDIRMLSSDSCAPCASASAWLTVHSVAHTECSIERDAACRADFQASLSPGTPVLLVRGQTQVGFNPARMLAALRGG